jgi:hypothetical protein
MSLFPGAPNMQTAGTEQEHLQPVIGIFVLDLSLWYSAGG